MKIPSTISQNMISLYGNSVAHGRSKQGAELKKPDSEIVNNSIEKRPALATCSSGSERLNGVNNGPSFTGDPMLVTKIAKEALNGVKDEIPEWSKKMGGANWFKRALHSVDKNETFYEAFMALVVAGIMKPAFVLMMPGAEMEDKQMSATKNMVSALLGFGLSNLILSPCSEAVNKITKSFNSQDPTKYVKDLEYIQALKSEKLLPGLKSTLGDSFKTTYKKIWDLGVSPLKAGMTIALTPLILKLFFGKTNEKKKAQKQAKRNEPSLQNSSVYNAIRAQSNLNNSAKKVNFKGQENNSPSFTGNPHKLIHFAKDACESAGQTVLNKEKENVSKGLFSALGSIGGLISKGKKNYCEFLAEPIAKGMGLISGTKVARKIVEGTAHFEKPSPRWSDLTSVAITYFYISNTAKSETMDEDRKLPLMINNAMVTAASSGAAFLIDKYTDKPMENLLRSYLSKHGDDMMETSKDKIITTLDNALATGKQNIDLDSMKHHSSELLEGGMESLTEGVKTAIKELEQNKTVAKAIEKGLIQADDVAKMAVSGFESQASRIYKNISKAKSLTIFTITVRFLVTVLMTPVIGRVVALVNKKLGKDKPKEVFNEHLNSKVEHPETLGIKDFMSMVK